MTNKNAVEGASTSLVDPGDDGSVWAIGPHASVPDTDSAVGAWFLGPRGENAEELEHLLLEALRDHVFWRRNFHPEDPVAITEEMKRSLGYVVAKGHVREQLQAMLALLKKSVPFFSMRYQGHMNWDMTIPGVLGYFAAMLYNANNVALEASTATTEFERIVGDELCTMLGFRGEGPIDGDPPRGWGHITCDGTVANIEAMWAARNLKFFPVSLRAAIDEGDLDAEGLTVSLPDGTEVEVAGAPLWDLLNLKADDVLALPRRLAGDPWHVSEAALEKALARHSVQDLGLHELYRRYLHDEGIAPAVVLVPGTKHYSWPKATAVLGLGRSQLINVPVDVDGRMDVAALRDRLVELQGRKAPVLQVVAVVGSTEESAVDPVEPILELRESLRQGSGTNAGMEFAVHADAAWGGYFASLIRPDPLASSTVHDASLSTYTRTQLEALGRVDSITIDPHKAGYVPYPAGALCYRNRAMRNLVTFTAPYLGGGETEKTVGIYGLEGSKPGAAPAAVYLSHRVIRPTVAGHGRLLGEVMFSCEMLYARLLSLALPGDPFVVVPLPRLPAERSGLPEQEVERQKEFIKRHISESSRTAMMENEDALGLIGDLGPDLNILVYAFNFIEEGEDGALNTSLQRANAYNRAIFDRLSIKPAQEIYGYELVLSSTHFSNHEYGDTFVRDYAGRLGLDTDDLEEGISVLRSVVMDPWIDDRSDTSKRSFIDTIADILRRTAIDVAKSRPWAVQQGTP